MLRPLTLLNEEFYQKRNKDIQNFISVRSLCIKIQNLWWHKGACTQVLCSVIIEIHQKTHEFVRGFDHHCLLIEHNCGLQGGHVGSSLWGNMCVAFSMVPHELGAAGKGKDAILKIPNLTNQQLNTMNTSNPKNQSAHNDLNQLSLVDICPSSESQEEYAATLTLIEMKTMQWTWATNFETTLCTHQDQRCLRNAVTARPSSHSLS